MAKNIKIKIPINRKSIHEIDVEKAKEIIEDPIIEASNPFDFNENDSVRTIEDTEYSQNTYPTEDNPFGDNEFDEDDDYVFEEQPDITTSDPATKASMDLEIDPNMPYFFVFGNSTAGKSAMLSGLLYYIQTSRIGQLRSLSLNEHNHHRKGDYILSEMTKKVRKGEFIAGTQTLDPTEFVFPTEINLEFQPSGKPSMPFCLLEMAGEDLSEIELRDEGRSGGDFDERINAYMKHPECNMIFICVVDVDTPENSEDLINQFLKHVHKLGHTHNPVLITVNKWDKIEDEYENVKDYLEEKLPILTNNLFDDNREMAYMKFSIGDVISNSERGDTYKFIPEDSEKLLKWMYSTATGISLDQEVKKSTVSNIIQSLKKLFSNE
ncbi:hypothetical protein SHK09_09270 [Polaribacter sp. PL03]|uniref:hypothetical protein n=1 Tax=Polaribacter sp. PL03 TaxID=3088353 RepID=UPI0029D16E8C|nr:hypothetical protein [Polaribacter sp. PL03]MDX6746979.1 hypothetical protein [Polaribacter sp. PL03]